MEGRGPSLRERPEDIPVLAEHLCKRLAANLDIPIPKLSADALRALSRYGFPGNVRELENILERAITLCDGGEINGYDLELPASDRADEYGAAATAGPEADRSLRE